MYIVVWSCVHKIGVHVFVTQTLQEDGYQIITVNSSWDSLKCFSAFIKCILTSTEVRLPCIIIATANHLHALTTIKEILIKSSHALTFICDISSFTVHHPKHRSPLIGGSSQGVEKKTLNPKRVTTGWCLGVGFISTNPQRSALYEGCDNTSLRAPQQHARDLNNDRP